MIGNRDGYIAYTSTPANVATLPYTVVLCPSLLQHCTLLKEEPVDADLSSFFIQPAQYEAPGSNEAIAC